MKTCGDCKHFDWARGITGRKLRKAAGRCNGKHSIKWPVAFLDWRGDPPMVLQSRPCYFDSQHAGQCAAFEKRIASRGAMW